MCKPKIIIIAPPILLNQSAYSCINLLNKVAEAPKDTNTKEKPRIKLKAPVKIRYREALLLWSGELSSSKDNPDIKEIYPGTKGRRQGERKERTPAIKAAKKETS